MCQEAPVAVQKIHSTRNWQPFRPSSKYSHLDAPIVMFQGPAMSSLSLVVKCQKIGILYNDVYAHTYVTLYSTYDVFSDSIENILQESIYQWEWHDDTSQSDRSEECRGDLYGRMLGDQVVQLVAPFTSPPLEFGNSWSQNYSDLPWFIFFYSELLAKIQISSERQGGDCMWFLEIVP